MILIGFTHLDKTTGEGAFFCPQCGDQKNYQQKSSRQWITLYFIPIVPLGRTTDLIECRACGVSYESDVLHYDPLEAFQNSMIELRQLTVLCLMFLNRFSADDLHAAQFFLSGIAGQAVDPAGLAQDLRRVADCEHLTELVRAGKHLSVQGKWLLLVTVRQVLEKKRALSSQEMEQLMTIGRAVGLPKRHIKDFLSADLETATNDVFPS